jgi:hypothetical protein
VRVPGVLTSFLSPAIKSRFTVLLGGQLYDVR